LNGRKTRFTEADFSIVMTQQRTKYINREISWLAFNDRVLQEAEDPAVPLLERLRFLGIYSNNQDEFFRVRVATVRRIAKLGQTVKEFVGDPDEVLEQIQDIVLRQQIRFDNTYQSLMEDLKKEFICVINETELTPSQGLWVRNYFQEEVRLNLFPIMIDNIKSFPTLRDTSIYLAVRLVSTDQPKDTRYSLIEIPDTLPRFVELPERGGKKYIILLDDVIRYNLDSIYYIFPHDRSEAFTIKFTRDAELDIDNDQTLSYINALEQSLKRRRIGDPVRLTYDKDMPPAFLDYLISKMKLSAEEDAIIPGARYHNFKDFMKFPHMGRTDLLHSRPEPLSHPHLPAGRSIYSVIRDRDIMLHFPYQSFHYLIDFLREAAINPKVSQIHLTLYRAAENSAVIRALINAARNGVDVTVVVELQARFDEEANIYWANSMQEEGIRVIFGVNQLKVHAKLCLIRRVEDGNVVDYAFVGTGNFNEDTARIYTDLALLTTNPKITREVDRVFNFFERNYSLSKYKELFVAPFFMRNRFVNRINFEISNARAGQESWLFFKMNSLVDKKMIKKLYEASQAGVKIRLMIRGICSLIPGVPGLSENIEAISIVDKYLEHGRVFVFCNGGDPLYYIGSADLMTRNLDHRVEVMIPIYDKPLRQQLRDVLEIQWKDNVKSRYLDASLQNIYRKKKENEWDWRSQKVQYAYFKRFLETGGSPSSIEEIGKWVPTDSQNFSTGQAVGEL
jgi:polyphosphate kinase